MAVPEAQRCLAELLTSQQEEMNGKLERILGELQVLKAEIGRAVPVQGVAEDILVGLLTPGPEKVVLAEVPAVVPGSATDPDKVGICAPGSTGRTTVAERSSAGSRAQRHAFRRRFEQVKERRVLAVSSLVHSREDTLHWFMHKPLDIISGVMTFMNSALLYAVLEREGYKSRVELGLESDGKWQDSVAVMDWATTIFALAFLVELIARLVYFGTPFLKEALNIFDMIVVLLNCVEAFILTWAFDGRNVTFARVCLVIRLLRVIRLAHAFVLFHELRVILRTIWVSCLALVWSMAILMGFMLMSAMFLVSALSDFIRDAEQDLDTRLWVEEHYGTASKALWTMFKITMSGGWPTWVTRLVDEVHWAYSLFFGIYVIIVVFATTRIIAAILLKHTLQVVEGEREVMIQTQMKKKARVAAKLEAVFHEADTTGDGKMTWEEFRALLSNETVRSYFAALELELYELESIFTLIDDGDGEISCEEFLNGVMRLKGQARSLDVLLMLHQFKEVRNVIVDVAEQIASNSKTASEWDASGEAGTAAGAYATV